MADIIVNTYASSWVDALWTGKEPLISDLAEIVFGLSYLAVRLDKLGDYKDKYCLDLDMKREKCLTLITKSIVQNGLDSM